MQKLRYALLTAAALFGLLTAMRAIAGPLSFPVSVRTPINVESLCGLLLGAALLLPADRKSWVSTPASSKQWVWPLALVALAAVGFYGGLRIYFLADDFVLVTRANAFGLAKVREVLTTAEASAFYRPLIHLTMALTARWAHFDPALWRANAVALHAVNSVLVFVLALRLGLSRGAAAFAGALFAIHGCLPESVVWIAGWFGTLSAFFVLAALILLVEHLIRDGQARLWYGIASLCAMMLALLSKETAYVFPFIAVSLVWARRISFRRAAPVLAAFFTAASVLFAYRWHLLGGIGGYLDLNSGGALLMKLSPLAVLRSLLLRLWAVLFFPINWSREPVFWIGFITAGYVVALMLLASGPRRSASLVLFSAAFVILSALPPLEQLLIGPDLQKSREIYLPLVGFALLLASAVDGPGLLRRWIIPATIVLFNFAALQHNIAIWKDVGMAAERTCAAASRCLVNGKISVRNLPGSLDGVYFLGVGFPECIGIATHSTSRELVLSQEQQSEAIWDPATRELHCDAKR